MIVAPVASANLLHGGTRAIRPPVVSALRPRRLQIAILASVLLHAALMTTAWVGAQRDGGGVPIAPVEPATVELLPMEVAGIPDAAAADATGADRPQQLDAVAAARAPPTEPPPSQPQAAEPPPEAPPVAEASPQLPAPSAEDGELPPPPAMADARPEAKPTPPSATTVTPRDQAAAPPSAAERLVDARPMEAQPPEAQSEDAKPTDAKTQPVRQAASKPVQPSPAPLQISLNGTDSLSNALSGGDAVIPAKPDDAFRNRPPIYPRDAARRGQHGSVVVVIHVAPNGSAAGADILESSGYPLLDKAALDAVRAWRFRPAMANGQTVPFDMPMRFLFTTE